LKKALKKSRKNHAGRKPFDAVLMFKVLVLQSLYNLSDDQIEYQIRDRFSFLRFLGLSPESVVPDAKTVWLFRESLKDAGVIEKLFATFEGYLTDLGYQAQKGTVVDARIVEVPKQRNTRVEVIKRDITTPMSNDPAHSDDIVCRMNCVSGYPTQTFLSCSKNRELIHEPVLMQPTRDIVVGDDNNQVQAVLKHLVGHDTTRAALFSQVDASKL